MKFNLDDYKGNYAMHCKTLEEAKDFCKFLHRSGRKWRDKTSYLTRVEWDRHRENTVYYFNDGTYGSIRDAARYRSCEILEWGDFMEKSNSEFTLEDLRSGDFVKTKAGNIYCIISNNDFLACVDSHGEIFHWSNLKSDLTDLTHPEDTIMQVRRPAFVYECSFEIFDFEKGNLLFNRDNEYNMPVPIDDGQLDEIEFEDIEDIFDFIENETDWIVKRYYDEGDNNDELVVFLCNCSPLGENITFEISIPDYAKKTNPEIFQEILVGVRCEYNNFDVDEHAKMLIEHRGENGIPESVVDLINDAKDVKDMLGDLYKSIRVLRKYVFKTE